MNERVSVKPGHTATSASQNGVRSPSILAVGDLAGWRRQGFPPPVERNLVFANFHEVTSELIAEINPALVVSPLLSRSFDCVDLAQVLHSVGYRGRYIAIDDQLPNPDLIAAEVRSLVPGLDFLIDRLG